MRKFSKLSVLFLALVFCFLAHPAFSATLTVTTVTENAAVISPATSSGTSDVVPNANEDVLIYLNNSSVESATVTITAQGTSTTKGGYGELTKADEVVVLTAGQAKWVGPFPSKAFNNASDQISLNYSGAGASSVEVTAFKGDGLRKIP